MSAFRVPRFEFQVSGFWLRGSRFRVPGSRFQVSGSGFRVQDFGLRVSGSGFRVSGFLFRIPGFEFPVEFDLALDVREQVLAHHRLDLLRREPGSGFRVSDFGFRASGFRFRVSGFGFRVSGVKSRAELQVGRVREELKDGGCRRWGSNPSGTCSQERMTHDTVTSTTRRAAHPSS